MTFTAGEGSASDELDEVPAGSASDERTRPTSIVTQRLDVRPSRYYGQGASPRAMSAMPARVKPSR